ncbi:Cytochrome c oxidase assembly protein cox11, mitochondrial [Rhizophlyctis rosea]|nr:Cytochrome c oxidase assembly protein cox11, mitochondrial [Rhizophlyctis rosea]
MSFSKLAATAALRGAFRSSCTPSRLSLTPRISRFNPSLLTPLTRSTIRRYASPTDIPPPTSQPFSQPTATYADARRLYQQQKALESQSTMYYVAAVIVTFLGLSYAAVPLYQLICTQTGLDGTPLTAPGHKFEPSSMHPVPSGRKVKIVFDSSTSDQMKWSFTPQTKEINVIPGETALAFYTAHNPTDEDVIGISTYSVVPPKAAQYFNKIQCFCFEEQKLEAHEEVDMPVFFYIDPEFASDPWMKDVHTITLHYTFFKSRFFHFPTFCKRQL